MLLVTVHRRKGSIVEDAEEVGILSVVIFQKATPFEASVVRRHLYRFSHLTISSVSCISALHDKCQKLVRAALSVRRFCNDATFETDWQGVRYRHVQRGCV